MVVMKYNAETRFETFLLTIALAYLVYTLIFWNFGYNGKIGVAGSFREEKNKRERVCVCVCVCVCLCVWDTFSWWLRDGELIKF